MSFGDDGAKGYIPTTLEEVQEMFSSTSQPSPQARRRRRAATNSTQSNFLTTPTIINPLICLEFGQAIVFKISINKQNRSLSHYPRFVLCIIVIFGFVFIMELTHESKAQKTLFWFIIGF